MTILLSSATFPQEKKGAKTGATPFDLSFFRIDENNQYALIIGINKYARLRNLNNAVFDAKNLKTILIERYKYKKDKIIELYNRDATQANIDAKLRELVQNLTPVDNLLVYFSGHGHLDKTFGMGFWLPANIGTDLAKGQKFASDEEMINASSLKISNSIIQGMMNKCKANHIFVVADACFAGHLLFGKGHRSGEKNTPNPEYYKKKSRQVLASGRERVSDGPPGEHSPFAKYFLKYLKDNTDQYMIAQKIIGDVMTAVPRNEDQSPLGAPAKYVGDEGGQFFFVFKYYQQATQLNLEHNKLLDELDKPEINRKNKIKKCQKFLTKIKSFPDSSMIQLMKAAIAKRVERFTDEIEKIKEMKTAYESLTIALKNKRIDVTEKIEKCRAFLDKFKNAPVDSEATKMQSSVLVSIGGLKIEAMEQEFQALMGFQSKKSATVGEKLKKWRDFKIKYTEVAATKKVRSMISEVDGFIQELEKQLRDQYRNLEELVKKEILSYDKRIEACQKFLNNNKDALENWMETKITGYIQQLEGEKRKKIEYQKHQEELAYRSLQKEINLKGYLEFKKKYPHSVYIKRLKANLKSTFPNLPPEKHWDDEISVNDQTYWEKEFENHHSMVWIPELKGWVDKYEVSNRQWKNYSAGPFKKVTTVTLGNMKNYIRDYPGYPVIVTFEEALEYCETYGLKLLSAKEWVIAAGKTRKFRYPWGNAPLQSGRKFKANSESFADDFPFTAPITSFSEYPSHYGLVNMAGNAAEWIRSEHKGIGEVKFLKGGGYLSKIKAFEIESQETAESVDTGGFRCIRYESENEGKK
jgi:formylglycine-generating enzyme required for sulfatase activity